jgi:hypothetical protein
MTTLNVNEGASSSAGSHNELSSLLPTNSELTINPTAESQQQNQNSITVKNEVVLDHNTDVFYNGHSRVENRNRIRHRHFK